MFRKIPEALLNIVIDYLAQRPYIEVHQLIAALSQLEVLAHEAVLPKEEER